MKIILEVLLFDLIAATCFNNDETFISILPNLCYFLLQYHKIELLLIEYIEGIRVFH